MQEVDAGLIRRCQAGDEAAWNKLMDLSRPCILRFVRKLCQNAVDQEDIVIEVQMRIYRYLDRLQEPEHFYTWIYRMVRHVCLDHYRTIKRHQHLPLLDADSLSIPGPEGRTLDRERCRELLRAMRCLPKKQRELVEGLVEGDSYAALSERYNLPLGTVKGRLFRARQRLMECAE